MNQFSKNINNDGSQGEDTLVGHLTELRTRLIRCLMAVTFFSLIAWNFSDFFFSIIKKPILPHLPRGALVFTAPMDKFMAHFKVSILSGVILACPIWIHQIWMFIAPGLYKNEKKFGYYFILFGTFFFLAGVFFVYFVVYPLAFGFLLNFGDSLDAPMITIKDYLSFFFTTTLVFGLAFELPLVLTILGVMGIVNKALLKKFRRYALVLICILSAFITPPDVISMILLVLPLYGLYELSIFSVGWFKAKKV